MINMALAHDVGDKPSFMQQALNISRFDKAPLLEVGPYKNYDQRNRALKLSLTQR